MTPSTEMQSPSMDNDGTPKSALNYAPARRRRAQSADILETKPLKCASAAKRMVSFDEAFITSSSYDDTTAEVTHSSSEDELHYDTNNAACKSLQSSRGYNNSRFVMGNVGLDTTAGKKLRVLRSYRYGVIVINMGDGGSLSFYDNNNRREWKNGIEGGKPEGNNPLRLDGKMDKKFKSVRSLTRSNNVSTRSISASEHNGKRRTSVYVGTKEFDRPEGGEVRYLYIPAVVPWRLQAVSENTFQIVVPPSTLADEATVDDRVECNNARGSRGDPTIRRSGSFIIGGGTGYGGTVDRNGNRSFVFKCELSLELAVYAKAAQCLDRDIVGKFTYETRTLSRLLHSTKTVRKRTAEGVHVEIQAARLDESDYSDRSLGYQPSTRGGGLASCGKSMRMDSIGEEEYRCYPLVSLFLLP